MKKKKKIGTSELKKKGMKRKRKKKVFAHCIGVNFSLSVID